MMLDERLHSILQYMEKHRAATLKQLAELNGVSLDTVRRDLVRLEDDGKLKRVRGGAVIGSVGVVAQAQSADTEHQDKKQAIAAVLGRYIEDGQAVALCGGTTCAHAAAYLTENRRRLTVLTNNLKALHILASAPSFTIIVPGGIVDADTDELFGQQCEAEIRRRRNRRGVCIAREWAYGQPLLPKGRHSIDNEHIAEENTCSRFHEIR